ncbi:MAG: hypothetical protein JXX14_22495 [Deltaproteobacteria bacterium]|nr:hypothetical protein [Deltaproteobacteria bacterium]
MQYHPIIRFFIVAISMLAASGCWQKSNPRSNHFDSDDTDSHSTPPPDSGFDSQSINGTDSHFDTDSDTLPDVDSGTMSTIDSATAAVVDSGTSIVIDSDTAILIDSDTASDVDSDTLLPKDTDTASVPGTCIDNWKVLYQNDDIVFTRLDLLDNDDIIASACNDVVMIPSGEHGYLIQESTLDIAECVGDSVGSGQSFLNSNRYGQVFRLAFGEWQMLRNRTLPSPAPAHSIGVYNSDLFAAGNWVLDRLGNSLMHWDGFSWQAVTEIPSKYVQLQQLESGALLAIPESGGKLAVYNGSTWSAYGDPLAFQVVDGWGTDATNLWLLADDAIHHVVNGIDDGGATHVLSGTMINGTADDLFSSIWYSAIFGFSTNDLKDNLYIVGSLVEPLTGYKSIRSSADATDGASPSDVDMPSETVTLFLAHFDGDSFTVLDTLEWADGIHATDLWGSNDGTLYMSGTGLFFDGNEFVTQDTFLSGRVTGTDANNIYAAGAGACRTGARFNGATWDCLDMPMALADIALAANGNVYGEGGGAVFEWTPPGVTTTLLDPGCSAITDITASPEGIPMAKCSEGNVIAFADNEWQTVPSLMGVTWRQMCYMGDSLLGLEGASSGSTLYALNNNTLTAVANIDAYLSNMTCSASGALLQTAASELYLFDGISLTALPAFPFTSFGLYAYALDDTGGIYVAGTDLADTTQPVPYLLRLENSEWRLTKMPFTARAIAVSAAGRVIGIGAQNGSVIELRCEQ